MKLVLFVLAISIPVAAWAQLSATPLPKFGFVENGHVVPGYSIGGGSVEQTISAAIPRSVPRSERPRKTSRIFNLLLTNCSNPPPSLSRVRSDGTR